MALAGAFPWGRAALLPSCYFHTFPRRSGAGQSMRRSKLPSTPFHHRYFLLARQFRTD